MKLRKNGQPAGLHRDAWHSMRVQHEDFARALTWLVSHSLSMLREEEPSDEEPKSAIERRLMVCRGMAEGRMGDKTEGHLSVEAHEIFCLLRTLMEWSVEQRRQAELCRSIAKKDARGRPRTPKPVTNRLADLMSIGAGKAAKAKPPGRRKLVDVEDAAIMSALAKGRSSGHTTDIAELRKLAKRYLTSQGRHAAGGEVEHIAKNLQKRAAGIRKSGSK